MQHRTSHRWWILVVLCLSSLVLVIDSMALTVAVPSMTRDLGASAQDTQWILDSYILVFAGLLLTSGSLGDRFGRRRVMIIGLLLFGLASLAGCFVANPAEMIAARVAMGVGGALIMPSTLSILITVFDETERGKAMAAWGSVSMLGLVGSPVLGGVLIDQFSWRAILLINVPVVALAILAGIVLMPESKGPWQKPDPLGAVLSAVGMTALVWWIIELPEHGAFGGRSGTVLAVAVVTLVGFVIWQNVTPAPMVPLGLFQHRNFSGGSLSLALLQIGNGGLLLVLTQYLQFVLGYSPVKAGLAFVPLAVTALVGNAAGAGLAPKVGNRPLILVGMLVMASAFLLLATVTADTGFAVPALALGLLGLGAGLAMPAAVGARRWGTTRRSFLSGRTGRTPRPGVCCDWSRGTCASSRARSPGPAARSGRSSPGRRERSPSQFNLARRTSAASRSGRSPFHAGWRSRPSGVQERKVTSATRTGLTHSAC
jgi:EmrB/QacA subfamily drug resistance transporter